ncbi:MAG: response regulator containing a CheY-like receiver domain and an DNA-binding domain [Rhodocyclaceae bacterium]|nr:response regulator containing a CheY-like receiver domain and an DNA-binding domain [Rhodocyclaceae bacterium]
MNETTRLVLVDDHSLCRQGLSELLQSRAGMQVLATVGKPEEAAEVIRAQAPDLAIVDLRMGGMDGLGVVRQLRDEGIETPVVILTMSDAKEDMAAALRLGVRGYLLKDMEPGDVIESIRRAARGELVVAPAMAGKLASILQDGPQKEKKTSLQQLTERERQILDHVARGMSNKAIAKALVISHDTVKLHVRHILAKLNMVSRVEAAVFAVEQMRVGEGATANTCSADPASLRAAVRAVARGG